MSWNTSHWLAIPKHLRQQRDGPKRLYKHRKRLASVYLLGQKTTESSAIIMDIFEFSRIIGSGDEAVVKHFQDQHLLRTTAQYQPYGWPYSLIKRSVTGYQFHCPGCWKEICSSSDHICRWWKSSDWWALKTSWSQANATMVQRYQYFRSADSTGYWVGGANTVNQSQVPMCEWYAYVGHSSSVFGTKQQPF